MASEQRQHDARLPWYRVAVLWLGIFITLLILAGCIHLLIVSHQHSSDSPSPTATDSKQLTHLLGVPLSRETQAESPQAAAPPAEQP